MKKLFLSLILLLAGSTTQAQEGVSEWLTAFDQIEITGAMDVTLVRIAGSEAPKIVYDTRGSYTTKFRAEVKERVLVVRERNDDRRPEPTVVTIYYNTLSSLTVTDATVKISNSLIDKMLDIATYGKASINGKTEAKDLMVTISGHSSVELTGRVTYLDIKASTGEFKGVALEAHAASVSAQNGASVVVNVKDRLECSTSTNGRISYKGVPDMMRTHQKFMAGSIEQIK